MFEEMFCIEKIIKINLNYVVISKCFCCGCVGKIKNLRINEYIE